MGLLYQKIRTKDPLNMKSIQVLVILVIHSAFLFSQELPEYEIAPVRVAPSSELSTQSTIDFSGGSPSTISLFEDRLYIVDIAYMYDLREYDLDWQLIDSPDSSRLGAVLGSGIFKFADNGDVVGGSIALHRVDNMGNRLFSIINRDIEMDLNSKGSYTWWVTNDYVLFYSDENGERGAINREGIQLYGNDTLEIAKELRETSVFF
jgi:hypothetical protein